MKTSRNELKEKLHREIAEGYERIYELSMGNTDDSEIEELSREVDSKVKELELL